MSVVVLLFPGDEITQSMSLLINLLMMSVADTGYFQLSRFYS